ncbi:MAG: aspartate kinase [Oscillospiraceae bacterium]|nr:aspartate kinase [Candidatus Equicaccousia limihippi]
MALIVKKFGGSSVKDAERIKHVAGIITADYKKGNDVVVIVSAQGDTTDDLIEKAKELTDDPSAREMDMLLSAGEQISCSLLAMAIGDMGYNAVSLLGWQAGFKTNSNYGSARIKTLEAERIKAELSRNNIVVIAGFQGINKYDDITTLGRGGSDTSAVAVAAALKADLCQIYTDVDGVYTADPRKVKNARKINEIAYTEMLELATLGAQVLNNRSVEMASKYGVELEVLSSIEDKPGTIVKEAVNMEKILVRGVACDKNVARFSIIGLQDTPGIAFKVFNVLAKQKINVDIILQSIGRDGTKDISFTVPKDQEKAALKAIEGLKDILKFKTCETDDNVAKLSIVGAGMETHHGVAAKMFEALYDANINIQMISTSEIRVSVLIALSDTDRAFNAVHDAFFDK